jgi:hypothetical protein
MSKHAAKRQRRLLLHWLPWLMLAVGVVGLLLLISHPRQREEQRPQPAPARGSAAQQPCTVSTVPLDSFRIPEATGQTVIQPRPQPTAPRFVERISSDSTPLPLSLPLRMAPLDTISSLTPLEPIR